jgi:hypothetical protein
MEMNGVQCRCEAIGNSVLQLHDGHEHVLVPHHKAPVALARGIFQRNVASVNRSTLAILKEMMPHRPSLSACDDALCDPLGFFLREVSVDDRPAFKYGRLDEGS